MDGGDTSEGEDGLGETVCPCGKVTDNTTHRKLLSPLRTYLHFAQVYEEGVFMIQCDICRDWMHGECVRYVRFVNGHVMSIL